MAVVEKHVEAVMHMNHCVLNGLGVGHESLERIVAVTRDSGLTTKLTGAGGGGCAITLIRHGTQASPADELVPGRA